jgi:2-desacetyl-2-hydroxyethyl bacteriochlorophyllide A dehydrogenase
MNKNSQNMLAVVFDGSLAIKQVPKPQGTENEVLIRVSLAGICNTDHEIIRGYVPGFNRILGHEFIGIVEEADDPSIIGKRCTAEINFACGTCQYCRANLQRHCLNRSVMGIINRNGAFAEYITVPKENLTIIPDSIPDKQAIFIEPLAAALEILDQVNISPSSKVLLLGDGKLGLLTGHVLAAVGCELTVVGKYPGKLGQLKYDHVTTVLRDDFKNGLYDVVIEATGNAGAFDMAVANVRPRGTIVLKSTYAGEVKFNLSPVVVNEITIIGSRCGLFSQAVDFLLKHRVSFEDMISAEYSLDNALKAFEFSKSPDVLKVLLSVNPLPVGL